MVPPVSTQPVHPPLAVPPPYDQQIGQEAVRWQGRPVTLQEEWGKIYISSSAEGVSKVSQELSFIYTTPQNLSPHDRAVE